MKFIPALFALFLVFKLASAQVCGTTTCTSPNTQCCNNLLCYDPTIHQCCQNNLCLIGDDACCSGSGGATVLTGTSDCSFFNESFVRIILEKFTCGASPCPAAPTNAQDQGFNNNVWLSVINRFGTLCSLVYTGPSTADEWPIGRTMAIQLASTANDFSNSRLSLSSGNLYQPSSPGGIYYGIQTSNLMDPALVNSGNVSTFGAPCTAPSGEPSDPLCGKYVNGILALGGGLTLYNSVGNPIGAIGVAGDTPCYGHAIAWQLRHALLMDYVPSGVNGNTDNLVFPDTQPWGHPICGNAIVNTVQNLPTNFPLSKVTAKANV